MSSVDGKASIPIVSIGKSRQPHARRWKSLLCLLALLPLQATVHLLYTGYTLPQVFPALHRKVLRLLPRRYSCLPQDGPACRKWVDVVTTNKRTLAKSQFVVVSAGEVSWVKHLDSRWRAFDGAFEYGGFPGEAEREAGRYLRFIVQYYDHLPEHVAFVHGHRRAWHQSGDILDVLNRAADVVTTRLRPHCSADYYVTLSDAGARAGSTCPPNWCSLFLPRPHGKGILLRDTLMHDFPELDDPAAPCLSSTCCAQFMVPRERIRRRPKSFWEKALSHVVSCPMSRTLPGDAGPDTQVHRHQCYWNFMEYVWHVAMGNPARDHIKIFHEPGVWTDEHCTASHDEVIVLSNITHCTMLA